MIYHNANPEGTNMETFSYKRFLGIKVIRLHSSSLYPHAGVLAAAVSWKNKAAFSFAMLFKG
jgi:hypothetical protein